MRNLAIILTWLYLCKKENVVDSKVQIEITNVSLSFCFWTIDLYLLSIRFEPNSINLVDRILGLHMKSNKSIFFSFWGTSL